MNDYLEEALDNAEQLLEQVRRSEQGLAGAGGRDGATERAEGDFAPSASQNTNVSQDDQEVYNRGNIVKQGMNLVDNRENPGEIGVNGEEKAVNYDTEMGDDPARIQQVSPGMDEGTDRRDDIPRAGETGEKEGAVLAAQLEQLDRAASIPAGGGEISGYGMEKQEEHPASLPGLQSRAAYPRAAGGAGERWTALPSGGRTASGGEPGWAEQADRAFRRDSRRYDGGFYLY